ncbi:MAG: aminotransferase class V-fold PLP-dependent enzyme, partial [Oscillatoriales cyanobacterium]
REKIAAAIGAEPEEIIFTSGATEANNLAIKGCAEANMSRGRHIVTVCTEHSAVLDPCRYLESLGFEVTYLAVDHEGLIRVETLAENLRNDTILVSVMAANNEIGVLQPIAEIGQLCHDRGVYFHTDAAQAIGKIPLHVQHQNIDLMSLTAHKIYGAKGIGALYVRRRHPRVAIAPQLHGGGHERGLRSGTLYPPQIIGMAEAITIAIAEMSTEAARLTKLRSQLWQAIEPLGGVTLNGHPTQRLAGNLNVSFAGLNGDRLLRALQPVVAVSSGSACTSAQATPSHVLRAIGRSDTFARASIRFGLGRFTTIEEINTVAAHLDQTVPHLRQTTR